MPAHASLVSIFIAPEKGAPAQDVASVEAVAGKGLVGDRHFRTDASQPDAAVTLFALETLADLARETGISLQPEETRRNLITQGVPLNDLVGKTFRIGAVVLQGTGLCEPCASLARRTDARVLPALVHRGGIRARILSGGVLRPGDAITLGDAPAP